MSYKSKATGEDLGQKSMIKIILIELQSFLSKIILLSWQALFSQLIHRGESFEMYFFM